MATALPALVPAIEQAILHPGPGTLATLSALHTLMIVTPSHTAALQPALVAALTSLIAPEEDDAPNELTQAAMTGVLGRALLCAPTVFAAAVQATGALLQMDGVHVQLGYCWVRIVDSVLPTHAPAPTPTPDP